MLNSNIVFQGKRYWSPFGSGDTPPDGLPDVSRHGNDGVFGAGDNAPNWKQLPSGLWVINFVAASSQLVDCGDSGVAKSLLFWLKLNDTTESILEEIDNVGVSVSSGTMSYASWDNCFVNGVDTDAITAVWKHIALVSSTDIDVSAFRIGLVNTTYLTGRLSPPLLTGDQLTQEQINRIFQRERYLFGV